ncbi:MAG TPA: hypothetical protein VID27_16110 [Blastocatellia bacterium]
MAYKSSISIANRTDRGLTFQVEPWGEQIPMPPGTAFQVVAEAKQQGEIEIEYKENDVLVWGWTGSVLTVFSNSREI